VQVTNQQNAAEEAGSMQQHAAVMRLNLNKST